MSGSRRTSSDSPGKPGIGTKRPPPTRRRTPVTRVATVRFGRMVVGERAVPPGAAEQRLAHGVAPVDAVATGAAVVDVGPGAAGQPVRARAADEAVDALGAAQPG